VNNEKPHAIVGTFDGNYDRSHNISSKGADRQRILSIFQVNNTLGYSSNCKIIKLNQLELRCAKFIMEDA